MHRLADGIINPDERIDLVDLTPEQFATRFEDVEYLLIRGGRETVYAISRTTREALLAIVEPAFEAGGTLAAEDAREFVILDGPRLRLQAARYLSQHGR